MTAIERLSAEGLAAARPLRGVAAQAARDAALLAAHAEGHAPSSLSFYRFAPAVAVGRHQARRHEARTDHCAAQRIEVARRLTAGGALYLDPGQQCFGLVVPAAALGPDLAARLGRGAAIVARALDGLGIATSFKTPNDLQVDGRQKIASVFLAEAGGSALLFGSILAELDLAAAMQALLVPTEKLTVTGLEHARERMTSLAELLGRVPSPAELSTLLRAAAETELGLALAGEAADFSDQSTEFSTAVADTLDTGPGARGFETKDKVAGATLRIAIDLDAEDRVAAAQISTDGHVTPADLPRRLGAALAGLPLDRIGAAAAAWLADNPADMAGFCAEDLIRLIERAAAKWQLQQSLGLTPEQTSGLMLAGSGTAPEQALAEASVMLVPYCAKPNWCKWRHTIDCVECGKCEVGDAYRMARERNMEVVTITNFEHLSDTLAAMKGAGVASYVGMCCGEFFLKRHHAFRDSGMEAVLLDIEGATCYELKEEQMAYAGTFSAEAALDIDAVRKVMDKVPALDPGRRPCLTGATPRVGERHHELVASGCAKCSCRKGGA